jgi:hypothetical protein
MVATRTAEIANVSALTPKGRAAATTNSHAPNGLAANWLIRLKLAYSNEFARGRDNGGTTAGTNPADAVSARVSRSSSSRGGIGREDRPVRGVTDRPAQCRVWSPRVGAGTVTMLRYMLISVLRRASTSLGE